MGDTETTPAQSPAGDHAGWLRWAPPVEADQEALAEAEPDPQTAESDPQTGESDPQTGESDPQTAEPDPQTAEPDPQPPAASQSLKQSILHERQIVAKYLSALEGNLPKPLERKREKRFKTFIDRIEALEQKIPTVAPIDRIELVQKCIDLETEANRLDAQDLSTLEEEFIQVAKSYGERKGFTVAAWLSLQVPGRVLQRARILSEASTFKEKQAAAAVRDSVRDAIERQKCMVCGRYSYRQPCQWCQGQQGNFSQRPTGLSRDRLRDLAILTMRREGKTEEEIALAFGITQPRVSQILARLAKEHNATGS